MITLLWNLMSLQLYIYVIIITISFLLSCFLLFKVRIPLYIKFFTPFLLLSIILEFTASWLIRNNKSTMSLYNFSSILEITFYLWVLLNILNRQLVKKVITAAVIIYPILSLIDIFFIQKLGAFHSISYAFGCLLIIIFSLTYFLELFAKPKTVILSKEPAFWICSGLFFFYCISFPLFVFVNFMTTFPIILANNLQYILIVLNVFLYLLFSIAFLCRITTKKF